MSLRPRGGLARTLYDKCIIDEKLKNFDKSKWYSVDAQYVPECLKHKFVQLGYDDETNTFLAQSSEKSSWLMTEICHLIMSTILSLFLTKTSINGLLRRGSMFVFSYQHFLTLTSFPGEEIERCDVDADNNNTRRLLDLGAGDGAVTSVIKRLFDEVYVTEVSAPMKWILENKGFKVLDIELWMKQEKMFDVVTCLNLLDRCDKPIDILADIRRVLKPNGLLIVALVLPFKPYVEIGGNSHLPSQRLNISGYRFEDQVHTTVHNILQPSGYKVLRWSRVPYLCEGDLGQSYYWLDDAVFVLTPQQ